ncbi:Os08g0106801 [Oryza sativa Japonica Group]|uniref:Os08g0106801 protein n=1 Tax=Oryza sativa subsp. japonica TaxID=39947 RepID=A0A0P0XBD9_ORYSJ|nr:Os08g0106801 [Oryza sativa Japonica Group]
MVLTVLPHLISKGLPELNHQCMFICFANRCFIGFNYFIWTYEKLINPIIYDPIMNNAASCYNIYLSWEREEWSGIIKNFESSL